MAGRRRLPAHRAPRRRPPASTGLARGRGAGEDDDLVLLNAVEQGVSLLVQKVAVDAFRPQVGDPARPARPLLFEGVEFAPELSGLGVVFHFGFQAMLAVRGAIDEVARRRAKLKR